MDQSILTISSHVIHGYVGNKAIIFPLQMNGWEVDNLNTVNYSNHTGYGTFKGDIINNELLIDLLHCPQTSFLITGYLPNSLVIDGIKHFLLENNNNHKRIYLLDPILGDEGQVYVNNNCILKYQELINNVKIDIITPNQFELELLTNNKIVTSLDLQKSIEILKNKSIKFIVVTSCKVDKFLYCFVTTNDTNAIKGFKIPLIDGYFTGVGDLFAGLLIDRLYENYYANLNQYGNLDSLSSLVKSVNQVLSIMERILHTTFENGQKQLQALGVDSIYSSPLIGTLDIGKFELNLIESKDIFSLKEEEFEVFDFDQLNF